MYTKQEIILSSYREGKSQRSISRDLGISRKTVCKYLKEYDTSKSELPSKELPYADYLSSTPRYRTPSRENSRLSAAIKQQKRLSYQLIPKSDPQVYPSSNQRR